MANCPLNRSNPPCDMEMDLLILQEAEREAMEFFCHATGTPILFEAYPAA